MKPENVMQAVMDRYARAVNASDSKAYADLFTPDAIRVPPGSEPENGREAIARREQSDYDMARWNIQMTLIEAIALGESWVHGLVRAQANVTFHKDGQRVAKQAIKSLLLEKQPSGEWLIKRYLTNLLE